MRNKGDFEEGGGLKQGEESSADIFSRQTNWRETVSIPDVTLSGASLNCPRKRLNAQKNETPLEQVTRSNIFCSFFTLLLYFAMSL